MAYCSRRLREQIFYLEETIQHVLNEDDDNLGMPSDKESDLDHQLYVMDDDRRQVLRWSSITLASHVLCMKTFVFKMLEFVVWISLLAIETCILVEIDLQVYICVPKVWFIGPKVYFFSHFAVCLMGRVSHVGMQRFSWWRELCVVLLGNAILSNFFLTNTRITFFLT